MFKSSKTLTHQWDQYKVAGHKAGKLYFWLDQLLGRAPLIEIRLIDKYHLYRYIFKMR